MSQITIVGAQGLIGSRIAMALGEVAKLAPRNLSSFEPSSVLIWAAGTSNSRISNLESGNAFREMLRTLEDLDFTQLNRFILLSSAGAVYGSNRGIHVTEYSTLQPETPYAKLKVDIENEIRVRCQKYGIGLDILRLANVYANAGFGLIAKLINGSERVQKISLYASLDSTKQYGHVDDYAFCISQFAQKTLHVSQTRTVNVFAPHSYSIQRILELFSNYMEIEIENEEQLSDMPTETVILDTIHTELNLKPESWSTLEQYLNEYFEESNQ